MNLEIKEKLEELAYKKTIPFCYSCYKEAPTGCCETCLSDDLMRLLPDVGCEYGIEWVIQNIIDTELNPIDLEEAFEDSLFGCYPETVQVGWLTLNTVQVIKDQDPISWEIAKSEWATQEEEEGNFISFDIGSNYYNISDVEKLLEAD